MAPGDTVKNKHNQLLRDLHRNQAQNNKRLGRPLSLFTYTLVNLNLVFTSLRGPKHSDCIGPQAIQRSNRAFEKTFSNSLTGLLEELHKDPSGYKEKIEQYENKFANRPEIPFDTETEYYNLIIKDPLRIKEEHFLYQSLLEHDNLLSQKNFSGIDLGTGSGRLAFCMFDLLSQFYKQGKYKIFGLDINKKNLLDAKNKRNNKNKPDIEFVKGDMTKTPFKNSRFSLCNISSASYLIPYYERPFLLLEMCRIIQAGGEGIITGINPKFSMVEYAKCMGTSNLLTYIHPLNFYYAHQSAPMGALVSEMSQKRKDFTPSDTKELCSALKFLECEIKNVETWPQNSTIEDFYTGIHFKVTPETKKRLKDAFSCYL